jgi:glycosyltransferase involved in cell wall biosynthesis
MNAPVSVIITTLNEEKNISGCLDTLKWADEIIIVDSNSEDRTCSIAEEYTSRIFNWQFESNIGKQKQYALSLATHEWVFSLDADERVTDELRDEIRRVVSGSSTCTAYRIRRKSLMYGDWVRYGGLDHDWPIRLFLKKVGSFTPLKAHEGIEIKGAIGELRGEILHLTYPTISDHIRKIDRTTSQEIEYKQGFSIPHLFLSPISKFIRMYILQKGYRDGMRGFIWCALSAWYNFLIDLKIWERDAQSLSGHE